MPEFRHWDVGIFEILHRVARVNVPAAGLVLDGETASVCPGCHPSVEVFDQFPVYQASPVAKELRSLPLVFNHIAEEGRNPWPQVVAGIFPERLFHATVPGLCLALPAVQQKAVQKTVHGFLFVFSDVAVEDSVRSFVRQFVAFPADRFCRCGTVFHAGVDVAHPQDAPLSLRRIPFEMAFPVHAVGQVDDLSFADVRVRTLNAEF